MFLGDVMNRFKKLSLLAGGFLLAGAAFFAAYAINQQNILNNYKSMPLNLPDGFTYTAHTGCMGAADNSLESIEQGVRNGADIVEFDLNFNEAKEPVLSHDLPTGNEVTLDEAFEKVSQYPDLKVNVDLKSTAALEKIYPSAQKYGIAQQIFFTGVNDEFLQQVRSNTHNIPYYLNVDVKPPRKHTKEYLSSLVEKVKNSGAIGINFNKDNASKELVDVFHQNNLLVSIWTVDEEKDVYKILSFSPDNITTRNPDLLEKILGE